MSGPNRHKFLPPCRLLLILLHCGLYQAEGATNDPASHSVSNRLAAPQAKSLFLWENELASPSVVSNKLSKLDANYDLFGVYVPNATGRLDGGESMVGSLLGMGIPILKVQDDGSWSMAEGASKEAGVQSYTLRASQLRKTRAWLQKNHLPAKSPLLDVGVRVQEDEEGFRVNRLEMGTCGKILWFIFEERVDEDPRSQVEIRMPF